MNPGFLLHLSGPMQSWGAISRFSLRDTNTSPTRSGLIGLLASCLGRRREQAVDDLATLQFIVRADRPGRLLRDFHTVGGGPSRTNKVATAQGKRRPGDTGTMATHRYYLADAAFTVAVTGNDRDLVDACSTAAAQPRWPPFLGRRSCPPAGLLLLGVHDDPATALCELPLARPKTSGTITIDFFADHQFRADAEAVTELTDEPESFAPLQRRYRSRPVWKWRHDFDAGLCGGSGIAYLETLLEHHKGADSEPVVDPDPA